MAFLTPTVDVAVLELVDVLSGALAFAASRAAATRAAAVDSTGLGALAEVADGFVVAVVVLLDTDDTEVFGATPLTLAVVLEGFEATPLTLDRTEVAVVFRIDDPVVDADVLLTRDDEETCFDEVRVRDVVDVPILGAAAAVLNAGALVPDGLKVGFGAAFTSGFVEPTVLVVVRVIVDFTTGAVAAGFGATAPTLTAGRVVVEGLVVAEVILAAGFVAGDAGFVVSPVRAVTFEIGFAAGLTGSGTGFDVTAATFRVGATVAVFFADCVEGVLLGVAEFVFAGVAVFFAITSVTIGFAAAAEAADATAAAIAVSDGNGA